MVGCHPPGEYKSPLRSYQPITYVLNTLVLLITPIRFYCYDLTFYFMESILTFLCEVTNLCTHLEGTHGPGVDFMFLFYLNMEKCANMGF